MPDDAAHYRGLIDLLEAPYLAGDNPRAQSGFSGDEQSWERARRLCVEPVHRDGTYLDIGAGSGHLMDCVERWAAENGFSVEAHGLELSARLAELARARLPRMAGRIHHGNVMTWTPPQRYTFARTELGYVPEHLRAVLITTLLDHYLEPGGRAIICSYGSSRNPANRTEPVAELVAGWGFDLGGAAAAVELNGVVVTEMAWVEAR